jgi:hypothetical protein
MSLLVAVMDTLLPPTSSEEEAAAAAEEEQQQQLSLHAYYHHNTSSPTSHQHVEQVSSSSHGFQIPRFHFFLERSFSLGTGEERHAVVAAPFKKNMYPVLFFTIVLSSMHSTCCSLAGTHLLCGK